MIGTENHACSPRGRGQMSALILAMRQSGREENVPALVGLFAQPAEGLSVQAVDQERHLV